MSSCLVASSFFVFLPFHGVQHEALTVLCVCNTHHFHCVFVRVVWPCLVDSWTKPPYSWLSNFWKGADDAEGRAQDDESAATNSASSASDEHDFAASLLMEQPNGGMLSVHWIYDVLCRF